jgi:uncharacterized protein (TIGR02246 family)
MWQDHKEHAMIERFTGRRAHLQTVERNPEEYEAASREAIVELTRRMERAWNTADGAAYAASFTEDSDYIAFDGTHLRGRDANARHHQQLFDSVLRNTRLVFEGKPTVRFVAEDVAVVHTMGSVLFPWQSGVTPTRRSNQTLLAVRRPEGWRFTAFHNTRYRPAPLPKGLPLRVVMALLRMRASLSRKRPTQRAGRPTRVR